MASPRYFPALLLSGLLLCFCVFPCGGGGGSPQLELDLDGRRCWDTEREALLQFKRGLHDPANRLSSWVAGGDCCGWDGVVCDSRTGHVVELDLENIADFISGERDDDMRLRGEIDPSLLGLTRLESLDLSGNDFRGIIPDSLGSLLPLTSIRLSDNRLEGTIPETFGNLSRLVELDLSNNHLGGIIPKFFGNLTRLVELYLSRNHLSGVLSTADFVNLRNLEELSMGSNNFSFDISPKWVPPFRLHMVDMGSCDFGTLFPTWLRLQKEVRWLNLSSSNIADTIPDWYWSSTSYVGGIDLSNNKINGLLSNIFIHTSSPFDFIWNIEHLDLSNNSLEGSIPTAIGGMMPELGFLSLSGNKLNGSIPLSLCQLEQPSFLDMSRNNLSGDIPNCWGNFSSYSLWVLNFAHNALVGAIPSSFGSLSALNILSLADNKLTGKIPTSLRNCSNLRILDLGENKLTGIIPIWVTERMPSLVVLRLRSNNFFGNIPPNMSSLKHIQIIDVANNYLTGSIPPDFGNFSAMKYARERYKIYSMILSGIEPAHMYSVDVVIKGVQMEYEQLLQFVVSIELSNNRLSGSMPQGLGNLSGLESLKISGNMITGDIIQSISALHWLESLDLSRNNLSGMIPPLMSSLTSLSHLNLSFNNFSGMIPTGNQFNTFTDPSIYMGNPYLCGFPLDKHCEAGDEPRYPDDKGESNVDKDGNATIWSYLSMALGFIFGFWGVCGTLIAKRRWRYVFFQLVDDISDQVYVFVIVHVRRLKRTMRKKIARQHGLSA